MLDYSLLDFGNGRKLERFGQYIVDRPEVLARHNRRMSAEQWRAMAHGRFEEEEKNGRGRWEWRGIKPTRWTCRYESKVKWQVQCKTGPYKHIGVFPEQLKHWAFLQKRLGKKDRYLNLFAYTGAASLCAAKAGADVFHIDASRSVVNWAAQNAQGNGVHNIHWVCEDALAFAGKELKRGHKYAGISMDPPVYGRSKNGGLWKLEEQLEPLLHTAYGLLEKGGFLVLNTYSPRLEVEDMVKSCEKSGLRCTESGWLDVSCTAGRRLALSKFIFAEKG